MGDDPIGSITLRTNGKQLTIRGLITIFFVGVVAIAGAELYAGKRLEDALKDRGDEHTKILNAINSTRDRLANRMDLTSCVLMFSPEERPKLRGLSLKDLKHECPFLEE